MPDGGFRFERFLLDARDRRLLLDGASVELNSRYLDALILLVRERGALVPKDRFMEEVWRGVPVTDEALTQCVRTLRRRLGDDAADPRFIETVPKHGYRFIAPVEPVEHASGPEKAPPARPTPAATSADGWRRVLPLGGAGTAGGAVAGVLGGLFYGFAGASPPEPGMGAVSVLLVLMCLTVFIATIGAAGVAFGITAAGFAPGRNRGWSVVGGALGGMVVGAVVKLLGLDAFDLLFGRSPGDITGAGEGLALGGAVGLGAWLALPGPGRASLSRGVALAAATGGAAGVGITLLGGRLMGGSLELVARGFPDSRLRLDGLFGEAGFGPVSRVVTGGLEGALFGGCVVGAMMLASRNLEAGRSGRASSAAGRDSVRVEPPAFRVSG